MSEPSMPMSDSKLLTVSCRLWVDAILSADIPPTIEPEGCDQLWYTLGVPVSTLNCIKSENSDVENKKIQMSSNFGCNVK